MGVASLNIRTDQRKYSHLFLKQMEIRQEILQLNYRLVDKKSDINTVQSILDRMEIA